MKGSRNIKVPEFYPSVPSGKIKQISLRLLPGIKIYIIPEVKPDSESWVVNLEFLASSSADDCQVELAECLEKWHIPEKYMIPAKASMNRDELTHAFAAIILREIKMVTLEYDEDSDDVKVTIEMFGQEFTGRGKLKKKLAVLEVSA